MLDLEILFPLLRFTSYCSKYEYKTGFIILISLITIFNEGVVKDSSCCGYGTDGKKSTGGYDCLMIPGN